VRALPASRLRRRPATAGAGLLVALGAAAVLAGCGATKTVTETVTVTSPVQAGPGPPQQWVEFGRIGRLTRAGDRYTLRFDPAWFLSGETANVAAAEDGVIAPGEPIPNDNYTVDESHRLYTYVVPAGANVTVLKWNADGTEWRPAPVSVAELAKIVAGTSAVKLFEPLDSGVWITVRGDRVTGPAPTATSSRTPIAR
jgi:hypothetical protein